VRPTSDRAREALFNILSHGPFAADGIPFAGAAVLDAFAGTGAFGLEALSRGAAKAVFIERDPEAVAVLRRNVAALGESAHVEIVPGDATHPPRAASQCAVAFVDPPYRSGLAAPALDALEPAGLRQVGSSLSSSPRARNWWHPTGSPCSTSGSTAPPASSSCAARTVGGSGPDFPVSAGKNPAKIDQAHGIDHIMIVKSKAYVISSDHQTGNSTCVEPGKKTANRE